MLLPVGEKKGGLDRIRQHKYLQFMKAFQIALAMAFASIMVYVGIDNGYLIAAYTFIGVYGATVWLPGLVIHNQFDQPE